MSGSHFDYIGSQINDDLTRIADDPAVQKRFPVLSAILNHLGDKFEDIESELAYDLSGDTPIKCDDKWEIKTITQLRQTLSLEDRLNEIKDRNKKAESRIQKIKEQEGGENNAENFRRNRESNQQKDRSIQRKEWD